MENNLVQIASSSTVRHENKVLEELSNMVTPGDVITTDTGFMRGHGTFVEDDQLRASIAGVIERVNKLICVKPFKSRYYGEIGDVVVGRIIELGPRRWIVDTKSKLHSVLLLSSVNLPGGQLRRRCEEDERLMRDYLSEGDLISAEVQSIFHDGSLSLHTRSLKYGKLGQGLLLSVLPSLVKRRKTHFHNLPCGASIILGNNGYIWISPTWDEEDEAGGFIQNLKPVASSDRQVIARLRNCILALVEYRVMLYDTTIMYTYEASTNYQVADLLKPEVMKEIVDATRQRLDLES